ncbi:hypothetical protein GGR54DRAFT_297379 [Hypoxylon sp. NC1633]|nr:hypothetical protein GGR54DRAFT_297379 [Hypoxylon sp. NC1633]
MTMALPAYRSLLRAVRVAFQGDERVLSAARTSIREGFRANASLEPTNPEVPSAIKHAKEVAAILRQNIVQGKKDGEVYNQVYEILCYIMVPACINKLHSQF